MTAARSRRWGVLWAALVVLAGATIYAVALDPGLWTAMGNRQLRTGELVAAERAYQRALRIDADHAPALFGLGWSYLRAGLVEEAGRRFERAVTVDAAYHGGYRGLAAVAAARGRTEEAEQHLRTAHELAPGDAGVLADLAGLYLDAGHAEQGIELYQRAIDAAPRRPEYRFGLAESYVALGQTDDARREVEVARGQRLRDAHFRGAADDLLLRAALRDVERTLEQTPLAGGDCDRAEALLDEAGDHLYAAVAAGLDVEVSRLDRRRLEGLRTRIERHCRQPER